MALVRTKYAGELAVLSTWLCALLPWSFTVASQRGQTLIHLRFLPVQFMYGFGFPIEPPPLLAVWQIPGFAASAGVTAAAWVWVLGSVLFLVPFALSVAYYLAEDRVTAALPADPVRVLGGLLALVGLVFAVATYLLFRHQFGTTIPAGTVFLLLFGVLLLRVERE